MLLLETPIIHQAAVTSLEPRKDGVITPVDFVNLKSVSQLERPLRVAGTRPDDYIFEINASDGETVTALRYIIGRTRPHGTEADIIPLDLVIAEPATYLTPEIVFKSKLLNDAELDQLGLSSLIAQLK